MNDIKISEHFNLKEFESAGNGAIKVNENLLELLEGIRKRVNKPVKLNSAYRNPEYNQKVGGVDESQHVKGNAVDISLDNLPYDADELAEIAENEADRLSIGKENLGLGKYGTFVHLDVRGLEGYTSPARWDNRDT